MIQFIKIIVLAIIILVFNWWFPLWWSILVLPFMFSALFTRKLVNGAFTSFIAGLIAWGGILIYQFMNGSDLIADKMADVFHLPGGGISVLLLTTFIGGILAALGGLTGSSLHTIFVPNKKQSYYGEY